MLREKEGEVSWVLLVDPPACENGVKTKAIQISVWHKSLDNASFRHTSGYGAFLTPISLPHCHPHSIFPYLLLSIHTRPTSK